MSSQSVGGGGAIETGGGTGTNGGTASGGATAAGGSTSTSTATPSGGTAGKAGSTGGTTSTGGTVAGECSPGDHVCKDKSILLTCDGNGKWPSQGTECQYLCKDNKCTGECKPGKDKCGPNETLITCDDNGVWPLTGGTCAYVCRNDACTGVCMPGKVSCSENSVMQCQYDGQWPATRYTPCDPGYSCDAAKGGCYCALTQCSNSRCVDTTKDPQNCGACDARCPGTCTGGACSCATQSSANLVPNAGVDQALSGWEILTDPALSVSRAALDVTNCSSSGSLLMAYQTEASVGHFITGPCVPMDPSLTYNMGVWIYIPKSSVGYAGFHLMYYSDSDCKTLNQPTPSTPVSVNAGPITMFETWKLASAESFKPTAGTKSARLEIQLSANRAGLEQAYFDSFYVTPAPGHF